MRLLSTASCTRAAAIAMNCAIAAGCGSAANDASSQGTSSGVGGSSPTCNAATPPYGTDPTAGTSFPDLEVADCEGSRISLDALRCEAELTLISVGAGWCAPCQEEAPVLQEIHESLGDRVQVVMVLFQDANGNPATSLFCNTWSDSFGLSHPVVIDPTGGTLEYFDVVAAPLNLLVDRDGHVLWSHVGGAPDDLKNIVQEALE